MHSNTPFYHNSQFRLSFLLDVRMFDHIDQPPQVPLYPTKRATHLRPRWTPYSVGRSPEADPVHASPHALPAPQIPPGTFNVQRNGFYSRPINNGGESSITVSTSSPPYPPVGISVSRRGEARRFTHPYDDNDAGRWRASDVGGIGRDDTVGIRAGPLARGLSPGPQPSDVRLYRAGYPERLAGTGLAKGRGAWSQQSAGEWESESGSSIAKAAAIATESLRDMTRRGSRGRTWGGGGGGTWS